MASFIRIGAVLLLLLWCFEIVRPFVGIVVWGMIIATALYPLHRSLTEKLNGREKTSAAILALIAISIIVLPGWLLGDSTVSALKYLAAELQSPVVEVPPPNERVASWPLIGERVYEIWSHAAMNLEETLNEFKPELQQLGQKALGMASAVVIGALQLIVATIIAGVLLTRAQVGHRVTLKIATKLAGTADRGVDCTVHRLRRGRGRAPAPRRPQPHEPVALGHRLRLRPAAWRRLCECARRNRLAAECCPGGVVVL
jgi:predicted PurR-regulated permease PerM